MNGDVVTGRPIGEGALPDRFDSPDYQVLLVANKYQKGKSLQQRCRGAHRARQPPRPVRDGRSRPHRGPHDRTHGGERPDRDALPVGQGVPGLGVPRPRPGDLRNRAGKAGEGLAGRGHSTRVIEGMGDVGPEDVRQTIADMRAGPSGGRSIRALNVRASQPRISAWIDRLRGVPPVTARSSREKWLTPSTMTHSASSPADAHTAA